MPEFRSIEIRSGFFKFVFCSRRLTVQARMTRQTRFIIILNPSVSPCQGAMPKFRLIEIEIRFGLAKATARAHANPLC
ncbi:MAG: hypothetical protein QOI53_2975 [Verrucomicrobiota bacterium]|nr:hypothetical protein [Verrucomicrobiota bacterium]